MTIRQTLLRTMPQRILSSSHIRVPTHRTCGCICASDNYPLLTRSCLGLCSLSIVNDVQIAQVGLNSTLFPGADCPYCPPFHCACILIICSLASIQVHDGFQKTFERTADGVLSGVQSALASTGASNVVVTGHSLGKLPTSQNSGHLLTHTQSPHRCCSRDDGRSYAQANP